MNAKQQQAVELLLSNPAPVVAEALGVRLSTVRRWMECDEFREALRASEREQHASLARIARQAAVNAASSLCAAAAEPKSDAKIMLELIKASGALETETADPSEALAEVMRQAATPEVGVSERQA